LCDTVISLWRKFPQYHRAFYWAIVGTTAGAILNRIILMGHSGVIESPDRPRVAT